MDSVKDKLREMIAEQVHNSWAGWIHYELYNKGKINSDGAILIPVEYAGRWTRQMNSTYRELTEDEKNVDRTEADAYVKVIEKWLKSVSEAEKGI